KKKLPLLPVFLSRRSPARIHPSSDGGGADRRAVQGPACQARLSGFATPRRYDLRLTPDLTACTFAGEVAVALQVTAPTRFLVLNAAELDVAAGGVSFAQQGSGQNSCWSSGKIAHLKNVLAPSINRYLISGFLLCQDGYKLVFSPIKL
ncbi:unnamed protein product, partial [Urochloa humidicola]